MSPELSCRKECPMWLVHVSDVLKMSGAPLPHEELRNSGLLRQHEPHLFTIFVSHQWLGRSHPDEEGLQLTVLRSLLQRLIDGRQALQEDLITQCVIGQRRLTATERSQLKDAYIWMDWFSIPQDVAKDSGSFHAAVASIPYYVESCNLFVALVPPLQHSSGQPCNYGSYLQRGWCLAEMWCRQLGCKADMPIVVAFNWDHAEFIMPRDWVRQLPLEGEWSDPSDKARVRDFLLMSLEAKIQVLENSNETDLCRYLKARIQEFLGLASPRRSVGSFLAHFGFQSEEEAIRQRKGMGPVACAVLSCDMDALRHFAGAGAPFTTRLPLMYEVDQMAGYTPLHLAVLVGRRTLLPLEELLRLRADPNTKDSMGAPVLGTCRSVGAVELLLQHRADVNLCGLPTKATPLTRACAGLAPKDVLGKLIDSKAAVNGYSAGLTTTPLANLVSFSKDTQEDQELASFLLQKNADPNFVHGIRGTWRLLELGCRAMQLMGREQTMLRYFGDGSTTPLGYAAIAGNPKLVSCLLAARADPNLRNRRGNTPVQLALTANVQSIFRQTCGSFGPATACSLLDMPDFNEDDRIVEVSF